MCWIVPGTAQAQQPSASNTQPAPAANAQKAPGGQLGQTTAPPPKQLSDNFKTAKDQRSYAIGMSVGTGLHQNSIDVDTKVFMQGLTDSLAGGKTLLTDDEVKDTMVALQAELRTKQEEKVKQEGVVNKTAGDAFLAANKTKPGVVVLPSGLQYKIITTGTGPKPTAADTVVCNYKGTLLDGTEFDSSYKRGKPAEFPVGQVIKGWTEALQLMPVGSKWDLYIPSDLAYGERGAGGVIGPNAALTFEVELLSIKPKDSTPGAPKTSGAQQQ
jgi:FKBP-type peptidyl-prolyl cis-trans isomerase